MAITWGISDNIDFSPALSYSIPGACGFSAMVGGRAWQAGLLDEVHGCGSVLFDQILSVHLEAFLSPNAAPKTEVPAPWSARS